MAPGGLDRRRRRVWDGRWGRLGRTCCCRALAGRDMWRTRSLVTWIAVLAFSSLKGIKYWSVQDAAWHTLITEAATWDRTHGKARPDFSPAELQEGKAVYFRQRDNRSSGSVLYRLEMLARTPERISMAVENVSPVKYLLFTVFRPGEVRSVYVFEKIREGASAYYNLSGVRERWSPCAKTPPNPMATAPSRCSGILPACARICTRLRCRRARKGGQDIASRSDRRRSVPADNMHPCSPAGLQERLPGRRREPQVPRVAESRRCMQRLRRGMVQSPRRRCPGLLRDRYGRTPACPAHTSRGKAGRAAILSACGAVDSGRRIGKSTRLFRAASLAVRRCQQPPRGGDCRALHVPRQPAGAAGSNVESG